MNSLKRILLLCSVVFVGANTACPFLPHDVAQPIPSFEERHKNMNLVTKDRNAFLFFLNAVVPNKVSTVDFGKTLSCNAVKVAYNAANEMLIGNVPDVDNDWCLYTRYIFDFLALKALVIHPSLHSMPWDKIEQTAKLHPHTTYGCAYSTSLTFTGLYYATVCIYKRTPDETRCFCN